MWTNRESPHDYAWPMRTKPASLALTIAALTLGSTLLSGCGLFTTAETLNMTAGDSGMDARVGDYLAQNVILVENEAGIVSLSATIINNSDAADNITAVTFNGNQATLAPADQTLTARGIVRFGYNSTSYADLAGSSIKAGDHTSK